MTRQLAILVCLASLPACAAEEGSPDDPWPVLAPDLRDGQYPPSCSVAPGRTYILDRLAISGPGQGYDLTGDGQPDNAMAFLGNLANAGFQASITTGATMYMFHLSPWMADVSSAPDDLELDFYQGIDADDDASNNVGGEGAFAVPAEQFDVSCTPTSRFQDVTLHDDTVTASRDLWSFVLPTYGTLEFEDMLLEIDLAPDMASFRGTAGAVWSYCSLARAPFPGPDPGSFLDLMVNAFASLAVPDVDRDGDGIERVIGNGETVARCIDGDGAEILGPSCACDPRMVDGYSIAFEGTAVPARITGVEQINP
jgi:hypothetical protein